LTSIANGFAAVLQLSALVQLTNGRFGRRRALDVAANDLVGVVFLPAHDLGDDALLQAGGVESRRSPARDCKGVPSDRPCRLRRKAAMNIALPGDLRSAIQVSRM